MTTPDQVSREERQARIYGVGLPARRAALEIVAAVLDRKTALADVLERSPAASLMLSLPERDRALARLIATTALRRKGEIDAVLAGLLDKPLTGRATAAYLVLLVAGAQLLFLDTPPHAAISLAVSQAQGDRRTRAYDKLVNAVARRIAAEGPAIRASLDAPRLNTPDWLRDRWSANYGEDVARRIAAANLVEAPLDLTVRGDPDPWAARLTGMVLPTGSVRTRIKGAIDRLDGFAEGAWWVQDAAAALPARLLRDVAGKRVADLCAAPGGKTAQLAARGANVVAVDRSEHRLALIASNLDRLKLEAHLVAADARTWRADAPFDAVLLDAPCSATGTLRRHPDIPYLKGPKDIAELAALQAAMLDNAAALLAPGGMLVYCVCSLEPEEAEQQIDGLLRRGPDLKLDPISAEEFGGDPSWINESGQLRTFPFHMQTAEPEWSGMDGFFATRLRRMA